MHCPFLNWIRIRLRVIGPTAFLPCGPFLSISLPFKYGLYVILLLFNFYARLTTLVWSSSLFLFTIPLWFSVSAYCYGLDYYHTSVVLFPFHFTILVWPPVFPYCCVLVYYHTSVVLFSQLYHTRVVLFSQLYHNSVALFTFCFTILVWPSLLSYCYLVVYYHTSVVLFSVSGFTILVWSSLLFCYYNLVLPFPCLPH